MSLGEILIKQGLLGRGKLEAALSDEQAQGTRFATYLVEMGILTCDQVALGLAEQFGVPPALEADFVRADPVLRKRLVVHQAIELQAIPLFFTSPRRVAVAMANPANPRALDRLAFILGATVDPMVTGEVALARQFELLYRVRRKRGVHPVLKDFPVPHQVAKERPTASPGPPVPAESSPVPAESWEIRPALRSHRHPPQDDRPGSTRGAPGAEPAGKTLVGPEATGGKRAPGVPPPLPTQRGTGPGQVRPLPSNTAIPAVAANDGVPQHFRLAPLSPTRGEPAAPVAAMEDALCFTPTPLTYIPPRVCDPPAPSPVLLRNPLTPIVPITSAGAQMAVEQIRFAADQQDLSDSLFTFMRGCFAGGAMFVVEGAVAQARFGFFRGQVRAEVGQLRFSLSLPSCLRIARSRRARYHGAPPPDGMAVHGPLWSSLGTSPPSDVLVCPVIVDGQVTLLLYAQGEPGKRINSLAASKIEQVCDALSSSLLRLAV
jgi:hypothetical protein